MKLYELASQYAYLNQMIEDGEISPESLEEVLRSMEGDIEIKVENIVKLIKNAQAEAKAIKEEEDRLATRRRQLEAKEQRLKQYAQDQLTIAKLEKVQAGIFKVRLQKNPTSVDVFDETKIPTQYRESQPDKILKKEVLEALKAGESVEGAKIAPEKKHLRFS